MLNWEESLYALKVANSGVKNQDLLRLNKVVSNTFLDKDSKSQDKDGAPKESK
jgi:hypothetical protein